MYREVQPHELSTFRPDPLRIRSECKRIRSTRSIPPYRSPRWNDAPQLANYHALTFGLYGLSGAREN